MPWIAVLPSAAPDAMLPGTNVSGASPAQPVSVGAVTGLSSACAGAPANARVTVKAPMANSARTAYP